MQGYVHALRKQLDPDTLVTQAPGYLLRVDPEALDLLEFQRLTREARSAPAARAAELRRQALERGAGRRSQTSSSKARPGMRSGS